MAKVQRLNEMSNPGEAGAVRALCAGTLSIGGVEAGVYNLPGGMRLIELAGATEAITGTRDAHLDRYMRPALAHALKNAGETRRENLAVQVSLEGKKLNVSSIFSGGKIWSHALLHPTTGLATRGVLESVFMGLVRFLARAERVGVLRRDALIEYGRRCQAILEAAAEVGLTALIDGATGYDKIRPAGELEARFDLLLGDALRPHSAEFPQRFWEALHRADGRSGPWWQHPGYYGWVIQEVIYNALAPGLAEYFAHHRPPSTRRERWHQWLREETGLQALRMQINNVTYLAGSCTSLRELVDRVRLASNMRNAQYLIAFPMEARS